MANNTEATKKDTTPAPFVFPQFTFGATPATGNPFSLPGQTPLVFGSGVVATPAAAPETKVIMRCLKEFFNLERMTKKTLRKQNGKLMFTSSPLLSLRKSKL